jgi:hypothetical protein
MYTHTDFEAHRLRSAVGGMPSLPFCRVQNIGGKDARESIF